MCTSGLSIGSTSEQTIDGTCVRVDVRVDARVSRSRISMSCSVNRSRYSHVNAFMSQMI